MPKRKTIAAEWLELYKATLAPSGVAVGSIQYRECRRFFYAGCFSMFSLMTADLSSGDEVTKEDELYIRAIQAEMAVYMSEVQLEARQWRPRTN